MESRRAMKKHFIHKIFVGLLSISIAGIIPFADVLRTKADEGSPSVLTSDTSNLTIEYFDDEDQTIPVTGAEFKVYQVASIGRDGKDNGAYLPLSDEIEYSEETDGNSYEKKVLAAYEKNPKLGHTAEAVIDKTGRAKLTGLPDGAYLVTETKTVRYHIRSIPFIVSTPEMNEDNSGWNFDVKCSPKSTTAGDLKISKVLKGNGTNKNDVFHFVLHLPKGEYRAVLADGTEKKVSNGETIALKGGQSATVYDLPSGEDYKVEEVENNQNGYRTVYQNESGKIVEKAETGVTVSNYRDKHNPVNTFVRNYPAAAAEIFGFAICALIVVLIIKKKNKENNKEEK